MSQHSYSEIEGYWIAAGGPTNLAPTMAAIAEAESSGSDIVQQGQPYSKTGWGLWQITPGNSVPNIGVDNQLLDPLTNARAAVAKYRVQGLGAWTTYTGGTYNQYLHSGVAPTVVQASSTTGTSSDVVSTAASSLLENVMKALGFKDVKDTLQRGALILFGAVLIIVGLFYVTNVGSKVVKIAGAAKAVPV